MMRSFLQRGRAQIRTFQSGPLPSWATVDPWAMSGASPQRGMNLVDGEWRAAAATKPVPDPLNGEAMLFVPDTQSSELAPFVAQAAYDLQQATQVSRALPRNDAEIFGRDGGLL